MPTSPFAATSGDRLNRYGSNHYGNADPTLESLDRNENGLIRHRYRFASGSLNMRSVLPLDKVHRMRSGGVASLIREDAGGVTELIFSMFFNPYPRDPAIRWKLDHLGDGGLAVNGRWGCCWFQPSGSRTAPGLRVCVRCFVMFGVNVNTLTRLRRRPLAASAWCGHLHVAKVKQVAMPEKRGFLARQQLLTWWWTRIIEIIWEVLIPLASTVLLLYGGYQILSGQLTIGELMMFLIYLAMLLDPLETLAGSAVVFQNNLAWPGPHSRRFGRGS